MEFERFIFKTLQEICGLFKISIFKFKVFIKNEDLDILERDQQSSDTVIKVASNPPQMNNVMSPNNIKEDTIDVNILSCSLISEIYLLFECFFK